MKKRFITLSAGIVLIWSIFFLVINPVDEILFKYYYKTVFFLIPFIIITVGVILYIAFLMKEKQKIAKRILIAALCVSVAIPVIYFTFLLTQESNRYELVEKYNPSKLLFEEPVELDNDIPTRNGYCAINSTYGYEFTDTYYYVDKSNQTQKLNLEIREYKNASKYDKIKEYLLNKYFTDISSDLIVNGEYLENDSGKYNYMYYENDNSIIILTEYKDRLSLVSITSENKMDLDVMTIVNHLCSHFYVEDMMQWFGSLNY